MLNTINKIILALVLGLESAYAIQVDPTEEPTRTLRCTTPLEYTNGETIPEGDIAEIRLYRSTDGVNYTQISSGAECRFVVDTTALSEDTYYYVVTAVSTTYGTESEYSNREQLDIVVKRTAQPVTDLGWE